MADWTGAVKGDAKMDDTESHPMGSNAISERISCRQDVPTKRLVGKGASDTMDGRFKLLDGNQYTQVFSNRGFFAEVYPMVRKADAGLALRSFIMEFGVPEDLTIDGSKEQNSKGT
jgi:hypothetical protein